MPIGVPANADPPPNATAVPPTTHSALEAIRAWDDRAFAGLPAGSHPEVLTWERAYTLAVVRCRTPRVAGDPALAESLDPKLFAARAERLGIGDFGRFRADFFGERNDGSPFDDPSRSLFHILVRLQTIENARKFVAALEELKAAYEEIQGALPQPRRPVRLENWLSNARKRFLDEVRGYRIRLTQVKAELGLSASAPVIPDRTSLAGFQAVFENVDEWFRKPDRKTEELPAIVARLPRLEDVILGKIALGAGSETDPNRVEVILRGAAQIAGKSRGQGGLDDDVRKRIRRGVTDLLEIRTAYQEEGQKLLRAIVRKDEVFEQIMTPPLPGVVVKVPDMIALHAQILDIEDQLVSHWASFHAGRLALARNLRVLPGQNWRSFLAQIQGEPAPARGRVGNPPHVVPRPPEKR